MSEANTPAQSTQRLPRKFWQRVTWILAHMAELEAQLAVIARKERSR